MSLFSKKPKPLRTYKDRHGLNVKVLAEHKGPNRAQRRSTRRIDYGVPAYDKHPHATNREEHQKAITDSNRRRRIKLDTPLEQRQRHNALMRTSYKAGHAERVARREARKQDAVTKRLARA